MKITENGNLSGKREFWNKFTDKTLDDIANKVKESITVSAPYISDDGYWMAWDSGVKAYVKTDVKAEGKSAKSPQIIDGNWHVWDDASGRYVDTGVKASGESISDIFVAYYNETTYNDILDATKENKVVLLYEGNRLLAPLSTITCNGDELVFASHNISDVLELVEYICSSTDDWEKQEVYMVSMDYLNDRISSNNGDFKTAVLNCFPDADEMSFPLEETVSEVSEE